MKRMLLVFVGLATVAGSDTHGKPTVEIDQLAALVSTHARPQDVLIALGSADPPATVELAGDEAGSATPTSRGRDHAALVIRAARNVSAHHHDYEGLVTVVLSGLDYRTTNASVGFPRPGGAATVFTASSAKVAFGPPTSTTRHDLRDNGTISAAQSDGELELWHYPRWVLVLHRASPEWYVANINLGWTPPWGG